MISEKDRDIIISYAKRFDVKEIYLFGSSLDNESEADDIDLAVRGVSPTMFFDFYGKLLRHLSRPVDIVNLSKKTRFTELVERQAVKIYGEAQEEISIEIRYSAVRYSLFGLPVTVYQDMVRHKPGKPE